MRRRSFDVAFASCAFVALLAACTGGGSDDTAACRAAEEVDLLGGVAVTAAQLEAIGDRGSDELDELVAAALAEVEAASSGVTVDPNGSFDVDEVLANARATVGEAAHEIKAYIASECE